MIVKLFRVFFGLIRRMGWQSFIAGIDLMSTKEKVRALLISFLLTVSKFIEMGSLITVMPVVSLIAQPNLLHEPGFLNDAFIQFGSPAPTVFISLLASIACVMILVGNASEFFMLRVVLFYTAHCESRLSKDMMDECMAAPYSWHMQNHSVSLTRLFQHELNTWSTLFLRSLLNIFNHSLTIAIGTIMVITLAATKAIAALVVLGVVAALFLKFIRPRSLAWAKHQRRAHEDAVLSSSNLFTGSKDFKFSENQTHLVQTFINHYNVRTDATAHMNLWGNLPARAILLFGQIALLLISIMLWISGESSAEIMSQMAVLLLITSRVVPATIQLSSTINSFWTARPWIEKIHHTRNSIRRSIKHEKRVANAPQPPSDWKILRLDNLGFCYDKSRGNVLHDISLTIEFGKHYGFVGPSGSGKSSLIDLIAGLQKPNKGGIFVDNINLQGTSEEGWRNQIGYVSQHPFFADDTIRNNIAYGYAPSEINDTRIWEALVQSKLDDIVRDLPEALETRLGEQGIQFSGGQRQRLAIARALYKKPRLLILDEATSALDADSEEKILAAIQGLEGRVTVLNISHRPSAVAGCDQVFQLSNGGIVDISSDAASTENMPIE